MVSRITINFNTNINTIVNTTTITNTIKIKSPGCLRWWPSHRPLQPVQSSIELNVKTLRSSNWHLVISSSNSINTMCNVYKSGNLEILRLELGDIKLHLPLGLCRLQFHHFALASLFTLWDWVSSLYALVFRCLLFYSGFHIWLSPVSQMYTRFALFPMSSLQFEVWYFQKRCCCYVVFSFTTIYYYLFTNQCNFRSLASFSCDPPAKPN